MIAQSSPTEIVLHPVPLVGAFGHAEREVAAALIVWVCQQRGAWAPVSIDDIVERVTALASQPEHQIVQMLASPFLRPDFHDLAAKGFARWLGTPGTSPLDLTAEGLARLERWSRAPGRDANGSPA